MRERKKNKKSDEAYWRDIKKAIDEGHKYFWSKRGMPPPSTSYNTNFKNFKTGRK